MYQNTYFGYIAAPGDSLGVHARVERPPFFSSPENRQPQGLVESADVFETGSSVLRTVFGHQRHQIDCRVVAGVAPSCADLEMSQRQSFKARSTYQTQGNPAYGFPLERALDLGDRVIL
jgi:hypothetical protein